MKSIQPIRPSPAPRARARSSLSSLLSPPALRFTTAGEPPDGADAVDCVCLGVLAQVTMPGRITQRMKAPTALPWRRGTGSPPRHQGDAARGRPSPLPASSNGLTPFRPPVLPTHPNPISPSPGPRRPTCVVFRAPLPRDRQLKRPPPPPAQRAAPPPGVSAAVAATNTQLALMNFHKRQVR